MVSLSLLGAYLLLSSKFELKNINVRGVQNIKSEDVSSEINKILSQKKLKFVSAANYFVFQTDVISSNLRKAFPRIGQVKIEKVIPNKLVIEIKERVAAGIWCDGLREESGYPGIFSVAGCFYIDNSGIIFDTAPKSTGSIVFSIIDFREVLFEIGDAPFEPDYISKFANVNKIVSQNFPFGIKEFSLSESGEFEILTTEGWTILLGEKIDERYQLSNLKYILEDEIASRRKNLEYVDLRLGNKVYYKMRD